MHPNGVAGTTGDNDCTIRSINGRVELFLCGRLDRFGVRVDFHLGRSESNSRNGEDRETARKRVT